MTLGIYAKSVNYVRNGRRVEVQKWVSSRHNMGMVFDRDLWLSIKSCAKSFCEYDDYNWDWSLQHMSMKCFKRPMTTLVVAAPRCVVVSNYIFGSYKHDHLITRLCWTLRMLMKENMIESLVSKF